MFLDKSPHSCFPGDILKRRLDKQPLSQFQTQYDSSTRCKKREQSSPSPPIINIQSHCHSVTKTQIRAMQHNRTPCSTPMKETQDKRTPIPTEMPRLGPCNTKRPPCSTPMKETQHKRAQTKHTDTQIRVLHYTKTAIKQIKTETAKTQTKY